MTNPTSLKLMDDMNLHSAFADFRYNQREDPKSEKTANSLRHVRRRVSERQAALTADMDRVKTALADAEAFLETLPADFEGTPEPDTIATYAMFGSPNGITPPADNAQAVKAAHEAKRQEDAINMPWLSR